MCSKMPPRRPKRDPRGLPRKLQEPQNTYFPCVFPRIRAFSLFRASDCPTLPKKLPRSPKIASIVPRGSPDDPTEPPYSSRGRPRELQKPPRGPEYGLKKRNRNSHAEPFPERWPPRPPAGPRTALKGPPEAPKTSPRDPIKPQICLPEAPERPSFSSFAMLSNSPSPSWHTSASSPPPASCVLAAPFTGSAEPAVRPSQ